jgi:thiamine biosynthesis lipoprotein
MNELTFASMGTTVRLLAPADAPLEAVRDGIERLAARLTRFDPGSELSVLNADPRPVVPASPLLRHAVAAALLGARRTGGLADPTLLGALEDAGYATSRVGVEPASLRDALRAAPARRPAVPGTRWREVHVDHAAGTIARPPGVRLDLGGSAKGLAADWAARKLGGDFAVDCGGDVRVGGAHDVQVRGTDETLRVSDGAVATSGLDRRVWQRPDGSYAHHLLDPATGAPAWTGLTAVSALAPTALEAEALAKAALLSGPERARAVLAAYGGILVHDSGRAERVGLRPRVRLAA